jgi:hypothetical protein
MGINGLLPLLKPVTKNTHVSAYSNKCLAVDGKFFLSDFNIIYIHMYTLVNRCICLSIYVIVYWNRVTATRFLIVFRE